MQLKLQGDKLSRADRQLAASKRALVENAHSGVSDHETLAKVVELRNIQDADMSILQVRDLLACHDNESIVLRRLVMHPQNDLTLVVW